MKSNINNVKLIGLWATPVTGMKEKMGKIQRGNLGAAVPPHNCKITGLLSDGEFQRKESDENWTVNIQCREGNFRSGGK